MFGNFGSKYAHHKYAEQESKYDTHPQKTIDGIDLREEFRTFFLTLAAQYRSI